jgi:hypothetical protein
MPRGRKPGEKFGAATMRKGERDVADSEAPSVLGFFTPIPQDSGQESKILPGSALAISAETIVVGAGLAGLTTAYRLAKDGHSVLVLEQDPDYIGGISRTVDYKGFLFDIGGHRSFSKSKEIVDLWNEILPDDFIERPRLSRIYYRGKFFSYPLRPACC